MQPEYYGLRVSRPDINDFKCTCRLTTKPTIELKKTRAAKEVPYVSFGCVLNSSPMNRKYATFFTCFAWGKMAQEIYDRLDKGYGIYVIGKLHSVFKRTPEESGKGVSVVMQAMIEVKEYMIATMPYPEELDPDKGAEPLGDPIDPA